MIKCATFPNKEFENKTELFKALKADKDKILNLKKSAIKHSQPIESVQSLALKSNEFEKGYIYPVINTTNVQDSHGDIHLKGIWNKSAMEQKGKVHYLINHKHELGSVIAYPKDVEIQIKEMEWSSLGNSYEGTTEALIFKTNVFDYSNTDAANVVKNKIPMQNSVSMMYVKIEMGINSDDAEFKDEKSIWNKYYNEVANKDMLNENGHGFFVSEAKIVREGSMVLAGSNPETPIIYPTETKEIDFKGIDELSELVKSNPSKENFLHFCNQVKALQEGEAVDKTLPKVEKPQGELNKTLLSLLKN